jgi:hypothetical protein
MIIVAVVALAALVALILALRGSGPRVTHITTRRDHDEPGAN